MHARLWQLCWVKFLVIGMILAAVFVGLRLLHVENFEEFHPIQEGIVWAGFWFLAGYAICRDTEQPLSVPATLVNSFILSFCIFFVFWSISIVETLQNGGSP